MVDKWTQLNSAMWIAVQLFDLGEITFVDFPPGTVSLVIRSKANFQPFL